MVSLTLPKVAMHIVASAGCASTLLMFQPAAHVDAVIPPEKPARVSHFLQKKIADAGLPVRLRIPAIGVDAAVEGVGLTPEGAMDLPLHPDTVGWYSLGVKPGKNGSAVFAGHLDWYNGKTAVFRNLSTLREGDILSIETDKGRFLLFAVREIRSYNPDDLAPDVFSSSGSSHLNLITCGGALDSVRKIYSKRIVVFTDAVHSTP